MQNLYCSSSYLSFFLLQGRVRPYYIFERESFDKKCCPQASPPAILKKGPPDLFFICMATPKMSTGPFFHMPGNSKNVHRIFFHMSGNSKSPEIFFGAIHTTAYQMRSLSSLIQTILSVPEFHRFSRRSGSRTMTAGRESHPAPKISFSIT